MDNKNTEEEVEDIKEEEEDLKRDVAKETTTVKATKTRDPPKNVSGATPASNASQLDERINAKIRGAPPAKTPGAVPTRHSHNPASKSGTTTATAVSVGAVRSTENPTLGKASGRTPTAAATATATAAAVTVGAVHSTEGSQVGKSSGRTTEDSAQARQKAMKRAETNIEKSDGDADLKAAKEAVRVAPVVDVSAKVSEKTQLREQVQEEYEVQQADRQLSSEDQLLYAQQSAHISAHVDPEVQSVNTYPMPSTMSPDVEPAPFEDHPGDNGGDVIEAYVPEEVVSAIGVEAVKTDEEIIQEEKKKLQKRYMKIAVCLIIVCVAVIVPVSLIVFKKSETQVQIVPVQPTSIPSAMPSIAPSLTPTKADEPLAIARIRDYVKTNAPDLLSDTSDSTMDLYIQKYQTSGNPQNQALKWILYDDSSIRPFTDERWMQRLSLAILYFSMIEDGPWSQCGQYDEGRCIIDTSSNEKKNFLNGADECDWFSIKCKNNIVTEINYITPNNVAGEFPAEVGLLTELKTFVFQDHRIYGSVPEAWKMLTKLEFLGVSRNELTGPWPSIVLEKTPLLSTLFLFQNNFTGPISSTIGLLSNLIWLKADSNNFTSPLPTAFGNLAELVKLELHDNDLSGEIPTEFGELKNLEDLLLTNNSFEGEFPEILTTLPKLKVVHLGGNNFNLALPPSIGFMGNGTMQRHRLQFQENEFSGEIPPELGRINSLVTLDLRKNTFEGRVPDELCEKTGKGMVDLSDLSVDCGEVECSCCSPTCFPRPLMTMLTNGPAAMDSDDLTYWKPKAQTLTTSSRSFPNQALDWFVHTDQGNGPGVNARQRITLALFYYATNGTNWIDQKKFLTSISECDWDGIKCDDGIVEEIIIESNGLQGYLPKELNGLPSLKVLKLGDNLLLGDIPSELGILEDLETLHLNNNNFVNQLPSEICDANNGQDKSILVDCDEVTCVSGCCDGC